MSSATKVARIKSVEHAKRYTVDVVWMNDASRHHPIDLESIVLSVKGFRSIRDPKVFAKVGVGEGGHSLVWPGDLDIGADRLFELWVEQSGSPGAAEFIRWRLHNHLSLSQVAEELGIARRTVAYYSDGRHEVPKYILLACRGWSAERRSHVEGPFRKKPTVRGAA